MRERGGGVVHVCLACSNIELTIVCMFLGAFVHVLEVRRVGFCSSW